MSKLIIGTTFVMMDEPCYLLREENIRKRRVQTLTVLRHDELVELQRDLGPEEDCKTEPFCIPGGVRNYVTGRGEILHTVGELMDIAEDIHKRPFDTSELKVIDVPKQYQKEQDKKHKLFVHPNYKQFGYGN
jgi:hypothetical protein